MKVFDIVYLLFDTRLSQWPGSNWWPHPYHGCALPTELHWRHSWHEPTFCKAGRVPDFNRFTGNLPFGTGREISEKTRLSMVFQARFFWISTLWSGRRGSNSLPSAWKADALPNELLPLLASSENKYLISKNYVGREGFEPSNSEEDRFTVCCRWPLGYLPW